ncbi:MAG TPA: arginase family protein [Methylomirabilota bacterium]|nr:arginase family protein [Methylomirabilota bacterium]
MAVKIVRQPKKIALIGAPSSAAGFAAGLEKAPGALRAAGLVGRLQSVGYDVADLGDCAPRLFAQDDEHPRARNAAEVVAGLNDLRLRVEQGVKSGALVIVLGGDCAQSMGVVAGARRYYKRVNLLWIDRDADLNTPASTPSGRLDGMVVAAFTGRGAAELVRFWGEPPLVREPDVTLFGLERIDPPEQEYMNRSPIRRVLAVDIQRAGAAAAAKRAAAEMHADAREFALHLDLDVIAEEDFPAVPVPGTGGLRLGEVRDSLSVFLSQPNLVGFDVAQFNPEKDPGGTYALAVVDMLTDALAARFAALAVPGPESAPAGLPAQGPASEVVPEPAVEPAAAAPESAPQAEPQAAPESETAPPSTGEGES